MNSIYVQIASYRDPELIPTLHSLLDNAKHPHLLTICVAHQADKKDKWDILEEFKNVNRFIIISCQSYQCCSIKPTITTA